MSQNAAPKQSNMSFLTGANAEYISHLYGEFLSNPARVDESWQGFFEALNDNEIELLQELPQDFYQRCARHGICDARADHHGAQADLLR
jgi:2-oxoglutarate dehydrogenase complex dehydrogenase (E1) component-like enzyme